MKAIILHGGRGTRLRPLTHTGPKQLIPIAGKPVSQYVVEDLRDAGITEIAIVLGSIGPERVKEYYGDGSAFGVKITYVNQGDPKGIAQAVTLCKNFVGSDKFVLCLGDNSLKGGITRYVKEFREHEYDAMLLLARVKDPEHSGVAEFDPTGKLRAVIEKPKYAPSPYAVIGFYFFTTTIFDAIGKVKPSYRGELEITDAIQVLLNSNLKIQHMIVDGWWKDTGTVEDILEANRLILDDRLKESVIKGVVEEGATIEGRALIEEGATIKAGATIRGPCYIGSQTTIGKNTFIGPYTSVGRGCMLEEMEIENSIVMDNCQIARLGMRITDSIIGRFSDVAGGRSRTGTIKFIIGEGSYIRT